MQDAVGLEVQQVQHYNSLDGAFAAEVAARAHAQAQAQGATGAVASKENGDVADEHAAVAAAAAAAAAAATANGSDKASDVPRNAQGQIVCAISGCAAQDVTFERKCEWTKHMDKHERPYVCGEPGCEKLRGFTYSGGLLRHQREVHKKHGGPRAMLMCPFPYCKRNVGHGFTRKENLHEHIRRVHRGAPDALTAPTADMESSAVAEDATGQDDSGLAVQQVQQQQPQHDDNQAGVYAPSQQEPLDQDQDRLVALQRSVQSYVPYQSKSRKRKGSSNVHDEAQYHTQLAQTLQSEQQQEGSPHDASSSDIAKINLLRDLNQAIQEDEGVASGELERLRVENARLRTNNEEMARKMRELEDALAFVTQQQQQQQQQQQHHHQPHHQQQGARA